MDSIHAHDYVSLLLLAAFSLVGACGVVNPAGMIRFFKETYPRLDENDGRHKSIIRFIGVWFIVLPFTIFVVSVLSQHH